MPIPINDFPIIPEQQYKQLNNLFNNIYGDFACDQIEPRRTLYLECYNIIKEKVINLFKSNSFWIRDCMSEKHCDHIYGEHSEKHGDICKRSIELKFDGKNYLCSRHIGIKHIPKPNNIPEEERCKGITYYGKPCKRRRKKNNYCIYHIEDEKKVEKINDLEKKILNIEQNKIINDIKDIVKKTVNINSLYNIVNNLKYNKSLDINKEVNLLNNIEIIQYNSNDVEIVNENINDDDENESEHYIYYDSDGDIYESDEENTLEKNYNKIKYINEIYINKYKNFIITEIDKLKDVYKDKYMKKWNKNINYSINYLNYIPDSFISTAYIDPNNKINNLNFYGRELFLERSQTNNKKIPFSFLTQIN